MATATGLPMREKVTFPPNVPQQIAVKWPDGKIVSGQFGDQVMYSVTDGRVMFLDMDVAAKINMLEVQPNEPFSICKRWNGQKGQPAVWDVWKTGERYVALEEAPPEAGSDLTVQLRESIDQAKRKRVTEAVREPVVGAKSGASGPPPAPAATAPATPPATPPSQPAQPNRNATTANPHVTVTDGRPKTRLADALMTVVQAVHEANEYAKTLGYAMPQFNGDEICRMVNTLMIERRQA